MVEKIKTYIEDLDKILDGGIPEKNIILLAGSAGTGKTTLTMQFLCGACSNMDEKTLFLSLNEQDLKLVENFKSFSFFNEDWINKNKLVLVDVRTAIPADNPDKSVFKSVDVLNFIYEQLDRYKPKRLVIDSISAICKRFDDPDHVRKFLFDLGNLLLFKGCSAILVSEVEPGARRYSNFGVEEFICDGIIYLDHIEKNYRLRKTLQVVKMRGCKHSEEQFLLDISESGIKLLKLMDH
ncbi:AAA family ATPase [Candidatus Woesearchaeota archaeon]|nr:AAA family ATPase [Candidatus Woesearchaeota archaeon]